MKDHTKVTAKMTIPAPVGAVLPRRAQAHMQGRLSGARRILPRSRRDLQGCGRGVPQGGCRCLRFDDTVWAHLCSQKELDLAKQHGDDPTRVPEIYAKVINEAIKNRPPT